MFSKVHKRYHKLLEWPSCSQSYLQVKNPKKFLYCVSYYNYKCVETLITEINFLETGKAYIKIVRRILYM